MTREQIIDCDIHNELWPGCLDAWLPPRWRDHHARYGSRTHTGSLYPKGAPNAARVDAWPPSGRVPGADLAFMQSQHLDPMNVEFGILNCLAPSPMQLNSGYADALCRATNDWQIAEWFEQDARLRGGVVVPWEDADLAAAEIDRVGDHPGFVQVLLLVRSAEPYGRRRYRPIFEAAVRHDLPVAVHFGGRAHGVPLTGAGWPSYYIEDHTGMAQAFQSQLVSLVLDGVFEELPTLKVVLIEGGFAWLPALAARMDAHWHRLRDEVALSRPPSGYVRDHIWLTTQPMEEPDRTSDLRWTLDRIEADKVMFSTDYPHWDFDDPVRAFGVRLTPEERARVMRENARSLYRLPAS